jgi:hypothetical protein
MAEAFNYTPWYLQADGPDEVNVMDLGKQANQTLSGIEHSSWFLAQRPGMGVIPSYYWRSGILAAGNF